MQAPPRQGNGLHDWILIQSRNLLLEGYSKQDAIAFLLKATARSGRTTQDGQREIENAVEGAIIYFSESPERLHNGKQFGYRHNSDDYLTDDPFKWVDKRSYWLPTNERVRETAIAANFQIHSSGNFSYEDLFCRIDFLICCAVNVWNPRIQRVREWIPLAAKQPQQFIVSTYCLTRERGKCDDNMGKPLYQVIEFDQDSKANQWKLLARLDREVRLGMIVDSGHKSLHGWFPVFHLGRREVKSFFRLATSLGADKHLWVASQYVRAPLGKNRKTNSRQEVIYWNEEVIGEHAEIVRSLYQ